MTNEYDPSPLSQYRSYWTTDRDQYVLFPVSFPDGRLFYDIYDREGTYLSLSDEDRNSRLVDQMLAAGVEVVDPDTWLRWLTFMKYSVFWKATSETYVLLYEEQAVPQYQYTICDRRESWRAYSSRSHVYEPELQQQVLDRMLSAGVEIVRREELDPIFQRIKEQEEQARKEVPVAYNLHCFGVECLFRILIDSANRPSSWRVFRRNSDPPSFFACYLGCQDLTIGAMIRSRRTPEALPPVFLRIKVKLSVRDAEAFIAVLERARICPYLNRRYSGGERTIFQVGNPPNSAEFIWEQEVPEEWVELGNAVFHIWDELETRRLHANSGLDFADYALCVE
jgi:hypothetical protein